MSGTKTELIDTLYDNGASLAAIIAAVGSDDATLRLIRSRLGVSLDTLRWHASENARHGL